MERLDDILGYDDLKIYQNSEYFSFSLDSIILANYSLIRLRDKKIVDLCTGNGVIPIILSKRTKSNIIGLWTTTLSTFMQRQKKLHLFCNFHLRLTNCNGLTFNQVLTIILQECKIMVD